MDLEWQLFNGNWCHFPYFCPKQNHLNSIFRFLQYGFQETCLEPVLLLITSLCNEHSWDPALCWGKWG